MVRSFLFRRIKNAYNNRISQMNKATISLIILFCLFNTLVAQNPQWINYTSGTRVNTAVNDGNTLWIGTAGGLAALDKTTGIPTIYTTIVQYTHHSFLDLSLIS